MRELALVIVFLSWYPWLTAVRAQGTGTTHLYAVIVNGGRNRLTNHERYWNDCAFLYQTLRQTYHVPKRNITVLMSDGGLPYEDMLRDDGRGFISSPEDLDGDGQGDVNHPATREMLVNAMLSLSRRLTADDHLFLFFIDHGGTTDRQSDSFVWLEHLAFGKIWMEGGCRAKLVQCLHVEVTNTGRLDYQGWWDVRDVKTGKRLGESDTYGDFNVGEVDVKAGETKDVTIWFFFIQPDSFELSIVSSDTRLFDYTVDIGENVAPKITGNLRVDMLERTDDGNILYGDYAHFRITGTATLTNEDENTIFAWGGFMDGGGSGIQVAVSPQLFGPYVAYQHLYSLASELKSGQTVTKDFEFEFTATPEDGKEYGISLDVLGNGVDQILFTVKPCTNTYWTADGHVKPLPVEAGQVLKVPCEALAVDLRGQYEMNTVFSIDTSEANPNCLYFLGYLDNVPQGFTSKTNIIRDYEAKEIIIDADDDYFCPMPFKAKTALFNYTPVSEAMGPASSYMSQITSVS